MVGHVDLGDSEGRVGLVKVTPDDLVSRQVRRNVFDEESLGESILHILEVERSGELLHPHDDHDEEKKGQDVVDKEITGPG